MLLVWCVRETNSQLTSSTKAVKQGHLDNVTHIIQDKKHSAGSPSNCSTVISSIHSTVPDTNNQNAFPNAVTHQGVLVGRTVYDFTYNTIMNLEI